MKSLIPVLVVTALLQAAFGTPPQLSFTVAENESRIQWFRDAKFGLFIHWGPSAISGEEISWGMKDRIEGGDHHKKVPRDEYMNLYRGFNPVKFDPDGLMRLASDAGMKYLVFVTKHHDGFAMWHTKQPRFPEGAGFPRSYSIADTPYQKDICRMVRDAARDHGLKLGWYYSTRDWTHPEYLKGDNQTYNDYYEAQVEELLGEYGPVDMMWFDHTFGQWDQYTIPRLFEKMYAIRPELLVNNRAARGLKGMPAGFKALDAGDFDTPENRMGNFQHGRAWESCMILSPHADHGGWSYRPAGVTRSLSETVRLLSSAVCGDGNMLLNLAPMPDGSLRHEELAILKGLAPWMKNHGQAIYGTRGGPWINGKWGGSTYKDNTVYLHIFEPGDQSFTLRALPEKVTAAETMTGDPIAFRQSSSEVSFYIPAAARDPHVTILRLTLDHPVSGVLKGPAVLDRAAVNADGTLALFPAAARFEHGVRAESRLEIPNIGYWTDPQGTVTWDLAISSPGTYAVKMDASCPDSGVYIKAAIGLREFNVEIPNTGSHDIYRTINLGTVTFPNAENTTVRLRAADITEWKPVNVRSVKLTPSNH